MTAAAKSSFPLAFRLLPHDQRAGMTALYAWLRRTDDLADEPDDVDAKRAKLESWKSQSLNQNHFAYPNPDGFSILPAFRSTVAHFQIPCEHLHAVVEGVASDLEPAPFATFAELKPYCHRVASAVGLACLAIWGVHDPRATAPAVAAGLAFQLTNILRDIGEDSRVGRIYLPSNELAVFGVDPEAWLNNEAGFRTLMRFQIGRAREYYSQSEDLLPLLPRQPRAMFTAIRGIYFSLLEEVARQPTIVLKRRLRVSTPRKLAILARAACLSLRRNSSS